MTSNEQSNPPPADAKSFKLPSSYRWTLIFCVIVACGFAALGLALPWLPGRGASSFLPFLLAAACLFVFGSLAFYACRDLQRSRDQVAVNDDGIWYLPHAGSPTFIRWSEVATVSVGGRTNLSQWLEVIDIRGRKIGLGFQLVDFRQLLFFVLDHTDDKRHPTPPPAVFHAVRGERVFLLATTLLFCLCCVYFVTRRADAMLDLEFGGMAALSLYGFAREPRLLRISDQSLTIERLGWKRVIAYDAIRDIGFVKTSKGSLIVGIARWNGWPVKLLAFRKRQVALYDALRAAWLNARGEQDGAKQA